MLAFKFKFMKEIHLNNILIVYYSLFKSTENLAFEMAVLMGGTLIKLFLYERLTGHCIINNPLFFGCLLGVYLINQDTF